VFNFVYIKVIYKQKSCKYSFYEGKYGLLTHDFGLCEKHHSVIFKIMNVMASSSCYSCNIVQCGVIFTKIATITAVSKTATLPCNVILSVPLMMCNLYFHSLGCIYILICFKEDYRVCWCC
jgi:hypothetical protein